MPNKVLNAKIACLDISLQETEMKMGVHVLINDPDKLEGIRARELNISKGRIQKILANVMAVRRVKKSDLKIIAKATGRAFCTSLTNMDGEESFDTLMVGEDSEVGSKIICDVELILIKGTKAGATTSVILRGPNDFYCEEMERTIHDALCVVKRVLESKKVVIEGECVEAAQSIYFQGNCRVFKVTVGYPKDQDTTDLVAKLRAYHNSTQTKVELAHLKWTGLDLIEGLIKDNKKAGVLESAMAKIKSVKFATQAAITILRIDDMIKLNPEDKSGKSYTDACAAGEFDGYTSSHLYSIVFF